VAKMTKLIMKFLIFFLGIFIGLLLREFTFIDEGLMPLIYQNQMLVALAVVSIIGLVLVVITKD